MCLSLVHPFPLANLQKSPFITAAFVFSASLSTTLPFVSTGRGPGKGIQLQKSVTVVKLEPSAKPSLPIRRSSKLQSIKDAISTMPSFVRNSRSYSFPPCIDSVEFSPSHEDDLPDIDENPFAHFLTPVMEEDDPWDELALSAGIIVPDGPRSSKASKFRSTVADKWARYVKQNHVQLHEQYHEDSEEEESFMHLDDHRLNDSPQASYQFVGPPTPRIMITEPTRGRAQELVSRNPRQHRRYSRTLSGHRHSWREPSPDLFTVDESEEDDMPVLKRNKSKARKTKDGVERRRSRLEVLERSRL